MQASGSGQIELVPEEQRTDPTSKYLEEVDVERGNGLISLVSFGGIVEAFALDSGAITADPGTCTKRAPYLPRVLAQGHGSRPSRVADGKLKSGAGLIGRR